MNTYIKHSEDDSLTHYGVKGMRWRHHKHKRSLNAGLTETAAEHYENIKDALDILELKNRAKKAKGGWKPVSRKQQKPKGKGKKVYRRKKITNSLVYAEPTSQAYAKQIVSYIRSYIGVSKAGSKKTKNAAQLGRRYMKDISKALKNASEMY